MGCSLLEKVVCVEPGLELQRTIMNLIPSNAVLAQAQGGTQDLPAITQYLSLVVGNDHDVVFFQSDMSSAFYLFRIPAGWSRMMCFNAIYPGHLLGLDAKTHFRPACAVIPMGWNSAVSVMQGDCREADSACASPAGEPSPETGTFAGVVNQHHAGG